MLMGHSTKKVKMNRKEKINKKTLVNRSIFMEYIITIRSLRVGLLLYPKNVLKSWSFFCDGGAL